MERTQRAKGRDYLVELGKNDTGNTNTNVGAREGRIDDVFTRNATGAFQLGADSDIASGELRYRFQEARRFNNLVGDYHCPEAFMDKVGGHLVKNFLFGGGLKHVREMRGRDGRVVHPPNVPLILGVWGGKGCGKTFNLELACKAMGVTPIVTSAGELEDENAGAPGRLIRQRYKRAGEIVKRHGVMSCLIINDIDAGVGWFKDTQQTVNNQTVCGTLMNLCDHPELVSLGEDRGTDGKNLQTARVPIIVTGNDLSTIYAPLLRDGRMEKWYWNPTRDDICDIVHALFTDDEQWSPDATARLVDAFPNQPLDFFGAARSKVYDDAIHAWMRSGESLVERTDLLMRKMLLGGGEDVFGNVGADSTLWRYYTPREIVHGVEVLPETVMRAAKELAEQQQYVKTMKLSNEYMKWQKNPEDLTEEERRAMEEKDSWRRAMKKREEDRRARVASMRADVATDEMIQARALLIETAMREAREKRTANAQQQNADLSSSAPSDASQARRIPGPPARARWVTVNAEEAFDAFKANECTVVDVRDAKSFRREAISGSVSVPLVHVEGRPLAYTYTSSAPDFLEAFIARFPNKEASVVLVGGSEADANGLDDPVMSGCIDALVDRGYENVAVVRDGYDGWVREYTPAGKKRLKEWKLDVVVGASGTSCVGAELPVVGSLAEERQNAEVARVRALERRIVETMNDAHADWKVAYDAFGRAYFYNTETDAVQWSIPSAYDASTKSWLLAAPPGVDDIKLMSTAETVEQLLTKKIVVVDVRNQFAFRAESINGTLNIPVRSATGSKLSPTYALYGRDAYFESFESAMREARSKFPALDEMLIAFVGGDDDDERAETAASYVLNSSTDFDVAVVEDSVSAWLKQFTASGKPKKILAAGAYKSDLLSKGAFNPFAGES